MNLAFVLGLNYDGLSWRMAVSDETKATERPMPGLRMPGLFQASKSPRKFSNSSPISSLEEMTAVH
jgi:hypothetical protein